MPRTKTNTSPRLLIRSSSIHAAGCYTLDPIPNGRRVIEYDGPRLSKELADERYADRIVTYLFGFGEDGTVIDGFGTAMFLNHSCAPNCETEETGGRVFIRAIRDIAAGEELVYEYNLYDSDETDTADCYCSAPHCRGTMYSDDELQRRAKLAARKKAKKTGTAKT
ncbi:SET domain-containing protein [Granulicella mallensis]|uniref:Nuclear protein SET n=1 Tax=Granulicella mallensis (strain ATCC BAA-1857 / DSM 23137 / MP5ACTX8) TaxID=682795 RepID=G8P050_GRAMM|nr:SET domain-containing protein-lysine N-methyltransferase [Granulicella mallensis]AEU35766.1 nuclear protein SET [Granulicella mallensis MP5ACTX8]